MYACILTTLSRSYLTRIKSLGGNATWMGLHQHEQSSCPIGACSIEAGNMEETNTATEEPLQKPPRLF